MSSAIISIVAAEAKNAAEGEPDLIERIKKAMRVSHNHWMATTEDDQFRGAIGGALLATENDDERRRIKESLECLATIRAMLSGVPVDAERALEKQEAIEGGIIPFEKLWQETKLDEQDRRDP